MYGKIFESLYTGSMVGSGALTFAVWGYVIANMKPDESVGAQVELNPKLLSMILGEKESDVESTIVDLCSPDPNSRSKDEEGRRLIKIGQFSFRVVNGVAYMKIRNEEDRREYFRIKKREQRKRQKNKEQVRSENDGRSARYERALANGDEAEADRIVAEDL